MKTGAFLLKNPHQECFGTSVVMQKKNHPVFPRHFHHAFLGSSHTFDASKTIPSWILADFSLHFPVPIFASNSWICFFFNVNGSNPKQMRTGGATHFPKRSRRHPGPGHAKADGDEFHQLATGWGCTGQHWSWRSQGDARGGWGWTYGEEKHGKTRGECLEGLPSGNLT